MSLAKLSGVFVQDPKFHVATVPRRPVGLGLGVAHSMCPTDVIFCEKDLMPSAGSVSLTSSTDVTSGTVTTASTIITSPSATAWLLVSPTEDSTRLSVTDGCAIVTTLDSDDVLAARPARSGRTASCATGVAAGTNNGYES